MAQEHDPFRITPFILIQQILYRVIQVYSRSHHQSIPCPTRSTPKELNDNVRELKVQLQTECPLDWFRKFDPAEHNPKIELNLLLHDAIQEQTLKQLVLKKGVHGRK